MKLTEVYTAIITALGLSVSDEGYVMRGVSGTTVPFTVSGESLVVPTAEYLAKPDSKGTVAFHPLCENILRKESPVFKKLRELVVNRLVTVISELLERLMYIAIDTDGHKKLKGRQHDFLSVIPEVDKKTLKALTSVLNASSIKGDHRIMGIYMKRGGTWQASPTEQAGEYARVAKVTFPILDDEHTDNREIFGVKMRVADRSAIFALLRYILPNCDEPDMYYSFGSRSPNAPNFLALMGAFDRVSKATNKVVDLMKTKLNVDDRSPYETLSIDTSWLEFVKENCQRLAAEVPTLRGNDGEIVDKEEDKPAPAAAVSEPSETSAWKPRPQKEQEPAPLPARSGWDRPAGNRFMPGYQRSTGNAFLDGYQQNAYSRNPAYQGGNRFGSGNQFMGGGDYSSGRFSGQDSQRPTGNWFLDNRRGGQQRGGNGRY